MAEIPSSTTSGEPKRPRRLMLISIPRTASNLLIWILALKDQPDLITTEANGYLFLPARHAMYEVGLFGKHINFWTTKERSQIKQVHQNCLEKLEDLTRIAEHADSTVFIKEHVTYLFDPVAHSRFLDGEIGVNNPSWTSETPRGMAGSGGVESGPDFSNGSLLPDSFLETWLPIFLIRHPALVFPSYYRAHLHVYGDPSSRRETEMSRGVLLSMTFFWTRKLYDWFAARWANSSGSENSDAFQPLILDADDYTMNPKGLARFCEVVQLDSTKLRFTWEPMSENEIRKLDPRMQKMWSTILASSGVITKEKSSQDINVLEESRKWKEEFGAPIATKLEQLVSDAMPEYEYLRSKRLNLASI